MIDLDPSCRFSSHLLEEVCQYLAMAVEERNAVDFLLDIEKIYPQIVSVLTPLQLKVLYVDLK